ncbi:choice-of-anchor L domain-containing protein [Chondromyces apiculatus]|nr:choice-of-anchor L domain-containing protein [Chondromyces apiculatus]
MPARPRSTSRPTSPPVHRALGFAARSLVLGALAAGAFAACSAAGGSGSSGGDASGEGAGNSVGGGVGGVGGVGGQGGGGVQSCAEDCSANPAAPLCDLATGQCVACLGGDGSTCAAGQVCCGTSCVDTSSDTAHCGACGTSCDGMANAEVSCTAGACVMGACEAGYVDCNGDAADGCEAAGSCPCAPGETQTCYNGPPGTAGMGTCLAGTRTCSTSGTGWGPCYGQVFPIFEVCGDGLDNDCNGVVDNSPDEDGDGWTVCQGDCCDSTAYGCSVPARVNPGAIEVAGTNVDEDCDGTIDNVASTCDANLALDDADPLHGAWAVDLCKTSTGPKSWGVVGANYVRANGVVTTGGAQQRGIQPNFGPNVMPQGGARMLAISSGRARIPGQPGACGSLTCNGLGNGTAPPGFPQSVPNCAGSSLIRDDIGLQVTLRAPTNATGYRFNFKFYSFEYPEYVCSAYNDQFIALVNPPPVGSINGNISFDSQSNPVSVNIAFFDVCNGCPLGTAQMAGTGFNTWDDAGGTGWLTTSAPITGGQEFTIRFTIWDTGDQALDSTTLIDNFRWIADGSNVVVGTE